MHGDPNEKVQSEPAPTCAKCGAPLDDGACTMPEVHEALRLDGPPPTQPAPAPAEEIHAPADVAPEPARRRR